jgi:prephenate dehydratase
MAAKIKRTVAFQGEPGAFSHAAALKLLGAGVQLAPCSSFNIVFEAVSKGEASHAVIPIENTLHRINLLHGRAPHFARSSECIRTR